MEQPEGKTLSTTECASGSDTSAPAAYGGVAATPSYVYAIGGIELRFPRPSVEKEFAQVVGRSDTAGLTDRQTLHSILSKRENRYLARQLCWVMTIEGLETYILIGLKMLLTQLLQPFGRI
jgi:hypothetical protein